MMKDSFHFRSISEFHKQGNLPKPEHPLISLIDYSQVDYNIDASSISWVQDFYAIGLKRNLNGKFDYGQQQYDFDEGVLSFVAPKQKLKLEINHSATENPEGWLLLIHPDFLWNTTLAKTMKKYEFFGYRINEALFLSEKEEGIVVDLFKNIEREYRANIDKFSNGIIISQIELLLNYAERYYERQLITRKITNHHILERLETVLDQCFAKNTDDDFIKVPTVKDIANRLHLSPNYLSGILKSLTGRTTQQHIQDKLIEKAKEKLSTTRLSISEIAYDLGFEHPASFSKLFKSKTETTPIEFRQSFN
ncbi:AraC family transcriptional regulator [Ulvibacterium marinum]|uniref:AraC family transcriptional regulator n=2 Tax=Ulvibacterium marinum TaxID=2419782 RepID=A0A3B0CGM5_9FLAO|nr:helix-turn-helix transcriptional regulator [Ulvibacterium marinum]RKN83529.1 AraC family transcriptional regulator [Ulvibacterium marinum]